MGECAWEGPEVCVGFVRHGVLQRRVTPGTADRPPGPTLRSGVQVNVFADANMAGQIALLAWNVGRSDSGHALGVYGMESVRLARGVGCAKGGAMDVAVALQVCGHVWSVFVTYCGGDGGVVSHGPVVVGATDTLLGTLRIVKWVCRWRSWAVEEVWPAWMGVL